MKTLFKHPFKMLALLAFMICAVFSVATGSETIQHLGNIAYQSITLDTLKGFIPAAMQCAGVGALASAAIVLKGVDGSEFTTKSDEELAKMTEEEVSKYYFDCQKAMIDNQARIEAEMKNAKTPEAIKELQDSIKAAVDLNMETVKAQLRLQGETISSLKKRNSESEKSFKSLIHQEIEEKREDIMKLFQAKSGIIDLSTKAVAAMSTGSATISGTVPTYTGTEMAPASNVNLSTTFIDGLISKFETSLASYPYTESVPKEGGAAWTAEATAKSQADFRVVTRFTEPKKVTVYSILSEESVTDIKGLQSIATDYLKKKHDLKRQNGILFGDGITPNPRGATDYGRVFAAGAMANLVVAPNFMDVVNACVTDIYVTPNYQDETPYMANIVMVNPIDFYLELVSAKDGNGLPLYPQAGLFNRVQIGAVTIIPFIDIPSRRIFVADLSKYNVSDYVPYSVKIGWINDQLIKNQFTMVGESRLHAFVKNLDIAAFIYDDIDDIKAAILKP